MNEGVSKSMTEGVAERCHEWRRAEGTEVELC